MARLVQAPSGITAGELDQRVEILSVGSVDDGTATVPGEPALAGRRYARKTDVSDGERMRAAQFGGVLTTRFLMRADALTRTINGTFILRCRGKTYQVAGVKEVADREGIEVSATLRPDEAG